MKNEENILMNKINEIIYLTPNILHHTVPNGKTCIITECILCNTSPNDVNIYQSFVKRAEGLNTKNTVILNKITDYKKLNSLRKVIEKFPKVEDRYDVNKFDHTVILEILNYESSFF